MKQVNLTVKRNTPVADNVIAMTLEGDVGAIRCPGEFINIKVDGGFLRRPISVCDVDTVSTGTKRIEKEAQEAFGVSLYNAPEIGGDEEREVQGSVTILYKVVGKGTEILAKCQKGDVLDVLTGLGNGFDIRNAGDAPWLIGGGIGSAPMMMLAKQLIEDGVRPTVLLGFRTEAEMFLHHDLYEIGCDVFVATEDGSYGRKGFVTDLIRDKAESLYCSYIYACGPGAMLKAVKGCIRETWPEETPGTELSLEERMGCGFGACMGCSIMTVNGPKRVCKDGPVFKAEELVWE
ncbi:MAG: dihydroorotate dehydrogenase electron transfer subunit [Lachnospiraceae bacterium]|nr:dihydroorotate dehydrogenase electron transfer subunit [Lachnospiraceae bacterium]